MNPVITQNKTIIHECYVTVRVEVVDIKSNLTPDQIEYAAKDQFVKTAKHIGFKDMHVEYEALL